MIERILCNKFKLLNIYYLYIIFIILRAIGYPIIDPLAVSPAHLLFSLLFAGQTQRQTEQTATASSTTHWVTWGLGASTAASACPPNTSPRLGLPHKQHTHIAARTF